MKQIYEDLSDDTDFDIIDLADVPDRDTVKRRKKKSQRDVNKTNKSEEVKKKEHSSTEDSSEDLRKERSKKARKLWKRQFKSFREKAFHSIRFDHHHSGEKDCADRRKNNRQTPADRSPWRNASDDRHNCI